MPEAYKSGSFAPPLSAEKLTAYKTLAETADPQIKEMMRTLVKMLEEFRKTPESKAKGTPHQSGLGTVVLLEGEEIKRMWEHVPWMEELKMWEQLAEKIDPDKATRNADKVDAWKEAVAVLLFQDEFPGENSEDVFGRLDAIRVLTSQAEKLGEIGKTVIEQATKTLFPTRTVDETNEKLNKWQKAWRESIKPGAEHPLPFPTDLEPVPLRDAAKHLIWYGIELCSDREPITTDKL